jgi:hypothetical protein
LAKPGPGNCSVCASKHRQAIELGLVHGIGSRVLAERFGLHKDAILRHSEKHLSLAMRAALLTAQQPSAIDLEQLRRTESEGILTGLVASRARLLAKGDMAAELGDMRTSVAVESAIAANYQLVAKLLGQLTQKIDVRHTNLMLSPDYLRLRQALITALRPFPEAARAVGLALHALEADAAKEIEAISARPKPPMIDAKPLPAPLPPLQARP